LRRTALSKKEVNVSFGPLIRAWLVANAAAALVHPTSVLAQQRSTPCTEFERRALDSTEQFAASGDDRDLATGLVERLALPEGACPEMRLARSTLLAWIDARALEAKGGAPELLGTVTKLLTEIESMRDRDVTLEVEYAQTTIRAAIAAAQDERPEMELLLTHARDLSERLAARRRRARWPHPFNTLAGLLWLEVDRYEEAQRAFERTLAAGASPVATLGLARSLARLDRRGEACAAYRRLAGASPAATEEARLFLATCP
jgi:tetratricopeptide (TPR) repeat protein